MTECSYTNFSGALSQTEAAPRPMSLDSQSSGSSDGFDETSLLIKTKVIPTYINEEHYTTQQLYYKIPLQQITEEPQGQGPRSSSPVHTNLLNEYVSLEDVHLECQTQNMIEQQPPLLVTNDYFNVTSEADAINFMLARRLRSYNKFYLDYKHYNDIENPHIYIRGVSGNTRMAILKIPVISKTNCCEKISNKISPGTFFDFSNGDLLFFTSALDTKDYQVYCHSRNDTNSNSLLGLVSAHNFRDCDMSLSVKMTEEFSAPKFIFKPKGTCMGMRICTCNCCCLKEFAIFDENSQQVGSIIRGEDIKINLDTLSNDPSNSATKAILLAASQIIFELYFAPRWYGQAKIGQMGYNHTILFVYLLVLFLSPY